MNFFKIAELVLYIIVFLLGMLTVACGPPEKDIALHKAVRANDVKKVSFLLANGANVNSRETSETSILDTQATSLIVAAGKQYKNIVSVLIKNGADVNATSKFGTNALGETAINGNTEILKLLLDAGAEIDATNKWGKTALMWAAQYKKEKAVAFLLNRGADRSKRNKDGKTALDFAKQTNYQSIIDLLKETSNR